MDKKISKHFKSVDPILFAILDKPPLLEHSPRTTYFEDLIEAIIQQQLSEKAGETIWLRFKKLFPKGNISPKKVLALSDKQIRAVGTSWSKAAYIKNIARAVVDKSLVLEKLDELEDEEVIIELTKVKGIGRWTAEMFLMFTLGRPDVFSHGDLGLRNAIKRLYKFKKDPSRRTIEAMSTKWKPYRTYASRILWRSLKLSEEDLRRD